MKVRIFTQLICGFLGVFIFITSCEKMLELPNDSLLPEDQAFVDEFSARSSVMGVYALLQDVAQHLVILGELQGDLLTVTENADNDLRQLNEHTVDEFNVYADASGFFKIIVNCNEVLHKIHQAKEYDENFSDLELSSYIAELKLIRAWIYFKMVQIYGNVPYFEEPLSNYDANRELEAKLETLQPEDYILDTIMKQIIEIDTFELNMLAESPFFSIRFNKFTNWALQGDIHLWRSNYSFAKRSYDRIFEILATEGFAGTTRLPYITSWDFQDVNWKNIFQFNYSSSDFETETSFVVPFSKLYNQQHSLQRMFVLGEGGEYLVKPTDYIINAYQAQQVIRYEVQVEHERGAPGDLNRGKGVTYDSIDGKPVVTKYSLFREPFDYDAGILVYRTADSHLKTCETYARLNRASDALAHLNDGILYKSAWGTGPRTRANLKGVSVVDPRLVVPVEDLIVEERALELAYEGHRWFDLMRIARHRSDPAYLAEKIAAKFDDDQKREEVKNRLMDMNNWYLPLKLK
ncbi:MAG TPA: RagB/SusD family nutrient uptake outer membrane protein [Bacteroidales bacterium]|nr:RagB/SusD family nutrient uptake outer membrane protein [Bacteroidales bacterium]